MAFFVPSFVLVVTVLIYFLAYFAVAAGVALVISAYVPLAGLPPAAKAAIPPAAAVLSVLAYRALSRRRPRGLAAPLHRLDASCADRYGGKAVSLGALRRAGLRVPFGYAVSERLFVKFIKRNKIKLHKLQTCAPEERAAALKEIRGRIRGGRFGYFSRLRLRAMHLCLTVRGGIDPALIVRSSFGGEDAPGRLAPGQYRSYGSYGSFRNLPAAIRECWCSFYTETAYAYRERMGVPHEPKLSLIIQLLMKAELLGTAAAANPASGFREEIAIDISAPPEEGAHEVTEQGAAESVIINTALDFGAPPADKRFPFLPELAAGLRAIARQSSETPLVEWAFSNGKLYFFQLRPLAGLPKIETYVAAGTVEMTPEPLCPMTVSLITAVRPLDSFITAPIKKYIPIEPVENILRRINGRFYASYEALESLAASLKPTPRQFVRFLRLCRTQSREARAFMESFRQLLKSNESFDAEAAPAGEIVERLKTLNEAMQGAGADNQAVAAHLTRVLGAAFDRAAGAAGLNMDGVRALPVYERGCVALERKELLERAVRSKEDRERYIERFGFLGPADEIDLSVPRINEAPEAFSRMLEAAGGPASSETAEAPTLKKLIRASRGQNLIPWDYFVFGVLRRWITTYATLREDLRYELLRGWALERRLLLSLAGKPPFAESLHAPGDIFFLELDELGAAETAGAAEKARARRDRHEVDKKQQAPPVVHLDAEGNIVAAPATERTAEAEGVYYGLPASPGTTAGVARRVSGPEDAAAVAEGDIAVVDECSPWMSMLFLRAAGVVAQSGGVVSHLALAAREYGRPMLVGVHGLRGADIEGRRIEIDAAAGTARIAEDL